MQLIMNADHKKNLHFSSFLKAILTMLFWTLLYLILTQLRNILYPIFLAILFSFLLRPIVLLLTKKRIPLFLSVIISLTIGVSIIYGSIFFISSQISHVISESPQLIKQATNNLNTALTYIHQTFDVSVEDQKIWLKENLNTISTSWTKSLKKTLGATTQTILTFCILPVYVFFFLYYSDRFRNFLLIIFKNAHKVDAPDILRKLSFVTQRYMSGMFLVVFILATVNSLGFYLIGLKHPVLFGIIAGILNFIPYFGTIFGFSIPFTVSLVIMDSPFYAAKILLMFFIIQFTENNILTPNIIGKKLKINPLVIIIGVLFGGSVWGLPGMFVIVPVIAMIKIFCMSIPSLQAWGFLLGIEQFTTHRENETNIKNGLKAEKRY